MSHSYGAKSYKQVAVTTASRGQILIMLYESAIKNLKRAVECIEKRDISGKGMAIGKAHDIVNELTNTLDFEVGGDIAIRLEQLYQFIASQLVKANLESNVEPLRNSKKILENLLDGWRGAVAQVERSAATPLQPVKNPTEGK